MYGSCVRRTVPARTHPPFGSINSPRGRYTSDPESRQAGHHQVGDHKDGHPGQVDHHLRELSQGHHHHEVGGYGHHQVGYVGHHQVGHHQVGHHQVGHHQVGQVGGQVGHPVALCIQRMRPETRPPDSCHSAQNRPYGPRML